MIFCVEDDRNIRELLVYTLSTTGYQAQGFSSGKELFQELKNNRPELILLDIMLPGEDGYAILDKLKSNNSTKEIPVIMVTAKGAEFDKVKGLDFKFRIRILIESPHSFGCIDGGTAAHCHDPVRLELLHHFCTSHDSLNRGIRFYTFDQLHFHAAFF